MKKPTVSKKAVRKRYSDEYRAEALKLAENVGVAAKTRGQALHEKY